MAPLRDKLDGVVTRVNDGAALRPSHTWPECISAVGRGRDRHSQHRIGGRALRDRG